MSRILRFIVWCACSLATWFLLQKSVEGRQAEMFLWLAVVVFLCGVMGLGPPRGNIVGALVTAPASRPRRGPLRHFTAFACLSLVLFMLFWVARMARIPASGMVAAWENSFPSQTSALAEKVLGDGQVSGAWLREEGSRRSLPRRANMTPSRKPEVFLRIENQTMARQYARHPLYVAAITFDRFRGSAWEIATESTCVLEPDDRGAIRIDDAKAGGGVWHTVVLSADGNRRTPLAALHGLGEAKGTGALERQSEGLHWLPRTKDPSAGYRYRACSHPLRLEDLTEEGRADIPFREKSAWLEMPSGAFGRKVSEWAASMVPEGTPLRTLRQIQDHLRRTYGYSLSTVNPKNLDPLENFLFEEKSGHCELFATAGALMARASGIPARVVYGWAGGTWYEHADWFVFRADEAHAWVEAWIDGVGWVIMDPTPPEALSNRRARHSSEERLPAMPGGWEDAWARAEGAWQTAGNAHLPWVSVVVSIGLVAVVWMGRYRMRARATQEARFAAEPWRCPASYAYLDAWRNACRSLYPKRDLVASTLRQQLAWPERTPEFADELERYHYGVCYQGKPKDRAKERALTRRIRSWTESFRE
jgi:hypothetical protein